MRRGACVAIVLTVNAAKGETMNYPPLQDITVLELGSSLAGPFAARLLGDLGAEVIKVEAPNGGDATRRWGDNSLGGTSATYQAMNNGKKSIVVDFGNADELESLKRLIADRIDVVVQNLRPGVADRLGLGPEAVRELNPRLVYCNVSAFGRTGPLASLPGYDPLIQAFSGIVELTGPADGPPARVGVPIIDFGTGMWAAMGAIAAINARTRTGEGCIVDAAMLDTALAWQTLSVATVAAGASPPQRTGLKGPLIVPNTGYETADGILMITVGTDRQFQKLCAVTGKAELAEDPRFATNAERARNEAELRGELEAVLRTETRAHWSRLLNAAEVANAPIQTVHEVVDHEQTRVSGVTKPSPDGSYALVANPLVFDGERPGFREPAPGLGEHTETILGPYRSA